MEMRRGSGGWGQVEITSKERPAFSKHVPAYIKYLEPTSEGCWMTVAFWIAPS